MGDPAWVAIVVTIVVALVGGFWKIIRHINGVEMRQMVRLEEVEARQAAYRHEANGRFMDQLNQLEDKIDAGTREAEKSHRELLVQVKDMALTMHDNFVSKPDLRDALKLIHEAVVDVRKEVGSVHTRVDDLYRSSGGRN